MPQITDPSGAHFHISTSCPSRQWYMEVDLQLSVFSSLSFPLRVFHWTTASSEAFTNIQERESIPCAVVPEKERKINVLLYRDPTVCRQCNWTHVLTPFTSLLSQYHLSSPPVVWQFKVGFNVQLKSEFYIHLSQVHLNSVFHNSWHLILVQIPCFRSVGITAYFKNVKCHNNSRENYLFQLISFITFPVGQKFTYTQLVFGSIAFKLFNLGQTFRVAFHKLPTIRVGEFWPIPPDRASVTESGL